MKTILVTGANGFIGAALCETLRRHGYSVKAACRTEMSPDRIGVGSIGPNTNWIGALQGVDTVVHLAAVVHDMRSRILDPSNELHRVNTQGTLNLARQAAASGIRRFVFISSIKVNGEFTLETPFTENSPPSPQGGYAISKWEAEQGLKNISNATGMEVVVIRPPLVYGPGVRANFLRLMRLVDQGRPLPLASISNHRSMIFIANLVDAIRVCCLHPNAPGKTFLVRDGEDIPTPELIRKIADTMQKPHHLFHFPPKLLQCVAFFLGQSNNLDRLTNSLMVDDGLIRRTLEWAPPYGSAEGIAQTVEAYLCANRNHQLAK